MTSYQERKFQRLFLVQPWITERGVVQAQILLHQTLTATNAFRNRITRELQMNTSKKRVVLFVDL